MVPAATAVWKDDDAEVIIRKIAHMSRSGNRSVSGIGGKVCAHTSVFRLWECGSTSVWGQQCDPVDTETPTDKWEDPSLSLLPSVSVVSFRHDIVIKAICAC